MTNRLTTIIKRSKRRGIFLYVIDGEEERNEGDDHTGGGQAGPEEGEGAVLRGHVQLQRDVCVVVPHSRKAEATV